MHEKNNTLYFEEKVTIDVRTVPLAEAMEMNGNDIRHTVAILFPKRRQGLVVIVRIDHQLPLRRKCMVQFPPLDMSKYDARLHSIDQLPGDQPLIGYHGVLKTDLRLLAEKLAAVSARENLHGGFFPGFSSSAKAAYWTPLTDDLPVHMTHVQMMRGIKDGLLFAEENTVKNISFTDLMHSNFASSTIERVFESEVLFIDRIGNNGRKVLIVTDTSLQLLDLVTGKTEKVRAQPENRHEKIFAYFRGRECATTIVGDSTVALDPFYFPTGI